MSVYECARTGGRFSNNWTNVFKENDLTGIRSPQGPGVAGGSAQRIGVATAHPEDT